MGDYKKLQVWVKADELVLAVYRATERFPSSELYGLRSQMRRAAVSVPSNLAEGAGRNTDPLFRTAIRYALGSACELEYQLSVAERLGFIPSESAKTLAESASEVRRMLAAMLRKMGT